MSVWISALACTHVSSTSLFCPTNNHKLKSEKICWEKFRGEKRPDWDKEKVCSLLCNAGMQSWLRAGRHPSQLHTYNIHAHTHTRALMAFLVLWFQTVGVSDRQNCGKVYVWAHRGRRPLFLKKEKDSGDGSWVHSRLWEWVGGGTRNVNHPTTSCPGRGVVWR